VHAAGISINLFFLGAGLHPKTDESANVNTPKVILF